MDFEKVLEKICQDRRTYKVPVLYIVQILTVVLDLFRLEEK